MIPTVLANIRAILKTNIATADLTNGATLVGCNIVPDYHGLDMVVALPFGFNHDKQRFSESGCFESVLP